MTRLALAAAVLCSTLIVVNSAYGWSPQQVGDGQQAYAQNDPYQLNIVQRGRDFLRYDGKETSTASLSTSSCTRTRTCTWRAGSATGPRPSW